MTSYQTLLGSLENIDKEFFFRWQVNLERTITFKNSKQTWTGIPVIAANMDTVGTFEMAKALAKVMLAFVCHVMSLHLV